MRYLARFAVAYGSGSSSALPAKMFAVDGKRIFVGSFKFDQRSAYLNTEMGVVIESPALAQQRVRKFDTDVPAMACEVTLPPEGRGLVWIERTPSSEIRDDTEPQASWWLRTNVEPLSVLLVEWLL